MKYFNILKSILFLFIITIACTPKEEDNQEAKNESEVTKIKPKLVTQKVKNDSDDPAIWINKNTPEASLVIGTDKGDDNGVGGIFAFNLKGEIVKSVDSIMRPNNIDIAYGLKLNDSTQIDIAVFTERYRNAIRVFQLPELTPIDNGGIDVFSGEEMREPMGVALYTAESGDIYAIVGRKNGPENGYLWQYKLTANKDVVSGQLVRKFGKFSGKAEIEAIAVDDELGYVYCSDEMFGVRKYYADPAKGNDELAVFGNNGEFTQDHEGISIYDAGNGKGYIIVSDQQANKFHLYSREGVDGDPHNHKLVKTINVSTNESDGSEVTNIALGSSFPNGLFVAMSDDGTFQYYDWNDIQNSGTTELQSAVIN
ncbi:phytase [Fulvivirga lutea]|uniref:Phytase n=1 Tax=Fulvivirga lutea TaxID=2810512 RepID=A0A974WFJ3_9BACT|nr:phytase [Fulvivirga lutea]QSE96172.1 phytase [Fulvivirga lutea]